MAINTTLFTITIVLGLLPLLLTARFKNRLRNLENQPPEHSHTPASLILPCKGLDPGFQENIQALIEQDYPNMELLFVVATKEDPAYDALHEILANAKAKNSGLNAKLLVAEISQNRAQKLTNQLAAVRNISDCSEIIVFVDSDIRPDRGFVRRLVGPLYEPGVGATTGYRWYHPPQATLGSLLRSTWNAGALPFLVDPKRNFAWGGAMAIRCDIFEQAKIANAWQNAVSDDMTLTICVRRLGLEVRFVPECIPVSYETSTIAETLEFTNRQSLISKVYFPPLWWSTLIGHAAANILLFYGFFSFIWWLNSGDVSALIGAGCLILLPLQLINAAWLFGSAKSLLPELVHDLDRLRWHYIFTAPLASVMTLINSFHSMTTRRILWRGVQYELRSSTETVVLNKES